VVVLPITGCAVSVILNLAGPVNFVFTVTGISTNELNSTVQVRLTLVPIGQMGLIGELVTPRRAGRGT
jgi:hypothetical protein